MFLEANRAFHDLIRASPAVQHEIDLFGAGLQRNPRTKASLTDRRAALELYRKSWESLGPVEEGDENPRFFVDGTALVVGGTFGILGENLVKFITLGSISRGIPSKEWDFPFEDLEAFDFSFYPRANVLAIVEEADFT